MTERERLIELLRKDAACDTADCEKCLTEKRCYQRLTADYLLENGVIVPPCKLGDMVFVEYIGEIVSACVTEFRIASKVIIAKVYIDPDTYTEYDTEDIFLTFEEAEKALEELKK